MSNIKVKSPTVSSCCLLGSRTIDHYTLLLFLVKDYRLFPVQSSASDKVFMSNIKRAGGKNQTLFSLVTHPIAKLIKNNNFPDIRVLMDFRLMKEIADVVYFQLFPALPRAGTNNLAWVSSGLIRNLTF